MNWMGKKIQKFVGKKDTVLDLGCGIMQATTGIYDGGKSLKCREILGVEYVWKYVDRVKQHYPVICDRVEEAISLFADNSFDVVICIDVLEHLDESDARTVLQNMKRIARKYAIIYTPKEWHENGDNVENAWGMGENSFQAHKCLVTEEMLKEYGYESEITEIDHNLFGVYKK
jgi:SAM-dependent methyltransferase